MNNGTSHTNCMSSCEGQSWCQRQSQSYGAIAYGPTSGNWGWSNKWGTKGGAERYALKKCASRDCRVVTWFNHQCGAVAADNATGDYGYDSGTTKGRAEAGALNFCTSSGGSACKVLVSACSF
jgi:Domain of unknown function (DUF4189)